MVDHDDPLTRVSEVILTSIEENKALVRPYFDLLNRKDLSTEEALAPLASSILYHRAGMPDVTGLTDLRQLIEMTRTASADMSRDNRGPFCGGRQSRMPLVGSLHSSGRDSGCRTDWQSDHCCRNPHLPHRERQDPGRVGL